MPFSGYLFYKWAGHPGFPDDAWGEALNPDQLVEQARRMVDGWGFGSLKLKGGVLPPSEECDAIEALRDAFPDLPLRLDPNGAWTPSTSLAVADRAWRESSSTSRTRPPGIDGMAAVSAGTDVPLATNMCVIALEHLPPAIASDAVQIVLSDHHLWGGLRRSQLLAGIAETWGLGLSMHSNSHLGVSLAAMTHLAAATPTLTYACDTHYPWKTQDVIDAGRADLRGRLARRTDRPWPRRRARPRHARAAARAVPRPAAYDDARTPSTCAPSSRTSRPTPPAGERRAGTKFPVERADRAPESRNFWCPVGVRRRVGGGCCPRCTRMAARAVSTSPARTAAAMLSCSRWTRSTWVASVIEYSSPSRVRGSMIIIGPSESSRST